MLIGATAGPQADSVLGRAAAELREGSPRAGVRRVETGMVLGEIGSARAGLGRQRDTGDRGRGQGGRRGY